MGDTGAQPLKEGEDVYYKKKGTRGKIVQIVEFTDGRRKAFVRWHDSETAQV